MVGMGAFATKSLWRPEKDRGNEKAANPLAPVAPAPPAGVAPRPDPDDTPRRPDAPPGPDVLPAPPPIVPPPGPGGPLAVPPVAPPVAPKVGPIAGPVPAPMPPMVGPVAVAPAPGAGAADRIEEHIRASKDPNAVVRQKAAATLAPFLTHADEAIRRLAAKALSDMGADAAPAAAALEKAAKDDDEEVGKWARQALIWLLTVDLKAKEPAKRIRALEQIATYKGEANIVGDQLIAAMIDKTPAVQVAAAEALEKVNPKVQKHVFTILFGMSKWGAIDELGKLGSDAAIALPMLFHFIANPKLLPEAPLGFAPPGPGGFVKSNHAAYSPLFATVSRIAPKDKRFAALVLEAVKQPELRRLGIHHLNTIEAETADKVKALVVALGDGESIFDVMTALEGYGKKAAPALPLLKKLKLSTKDTIREAARRAVEKIEE